jgi:hypothetical protein
MWKKLIAMVLALSLPAGASAGQLRAAVEKAVRELPTPQVEETRSRARFWSGIALIGGGAVLASLGGVEMGEDEGTGDVDEPGDDPEDSDLTEDEGVAGKTLLGGGIAAATVGGLLLLTGRKPSGPRKPTGPVVSARRGGVTIQQTISF